MSKICEIDPGTRYTDFRYSSILYVECVGQCVSYLKKIAWKHISEYISD